MTLSREQRAAIDALWAARTPVWREEQADWFLTELDRSKRQARLEAAQRNRLPWWRILARLIVIVGVGAANLVILAYAIKGVFILGQFAWKAVTG